MPAYPKNASIDKMKAAGADPDVERIDFQRSNLWRA